MLSPSCPAFSGGRESGRIQGRPAATDRPGRWAEALAGMGPWAASGHDVQGPRSSRMVQQKWAMQPSIDHRQDQVGEVPAGWHGLAACNNPISSRIFGCLHGFSLFSREASPLFRGICWLAIHPWIGELRSAASRRLAWQPVLGAERCGRVTVVACGLMGWLPVGIAAPQGSGRTLQPWGQDASHGWAIGRRVVGGRGWGPHGLAGGAWRGASGAGPWVSAPPWLEGSVLPARSAVG